MAVNQTQRLLEGVKIPVVGPNGEAMEVGLALLSSSLIVTGPPGIDGNDGMDAPWIPGQQGIQGQQGFLGLQGIPGLSGEDGIAEEWMIPGATGLSGSAGLQGTPGIPGEEGQAGEEWMVPGRDGLSPLYAKVAGSNATTTGQALVNITGLTLPLLANSSYDFEAILAVASSSIAGNQYGVNFSAAGASVNAIISGTLAAASQQMRRLNALNSATIAFMTVAADGGMWIRGIINTGANPGNLTIQHLKVTSGTSTVYIDSFLSAVRT